MKIILTNNNSVYELPIEELHHINTISYNKDNIAMITVTSRSVKVYKSVWIDDQQGGVHYLQEIAKIKNSECHKIVGKGSFTIDFKIID